MKVSHSSLKHPQSQKQQPDNHNHQTQEELVTLKILYGTELLQLDVCSNWTINKLKCLLVYLFPTLKFDQFQMLSGNYLLTRDSLLKHITSQFITITKTECKGSFDQYYSKNIRKILTQYQVNTQRSNYSTLHPCYIKPLMRQISMERLQNFQPYLRANNNQRLQNNQGFGILGIFRIFGSILLFQIISSLANYFQILVIIFVVIAYLWIEHHVGQNNRRRIQRNIIQRQNQAQQQMQQGKKIQEMNQNNVIKNKEKLAQSELQKQQKNDQQIKNEEVQQILKNEQHQQAQQKIQNRKSFVGRLVLFLAFVVQICYCYTLSLFPNWTVETHILANQQKINAVFQYVDELDGTNYSKKKKSL